MKISRRTFVKGSLAVPALPVVTSGCGNDVEAAPIVDVAVIDDPKSPRDGQIEVAVPRYPDLSKVGGAVMLRIAPLPPASRTYVVPDKGVLLIHRADNGNDADYVATRADCPHQGCPLGYSAADDEIQCPCHSSRFRASQAPGDPTQCVGLVTHLPARDNLTVYKVTRLNSFVYVDLNTDISCGVRNDLPAVMNGKITMTLAEYPALATVGGNIIGKPEGLGDTLLIARTAAATVSVVSDRCPHAGCPIKGVLIDQQRFHCYCHGSEFGFDGRLLNGPATIGIKAYATDFNGTTITIHVT